MIIEKIFQVLFLIIMTFGILGLPAFYFLNARKKRIMSEFEDPENEPKQETDSQKDTEAENNE